MEILNEFIMLLGKRNVDETIYSVNAYSCFKKTKFDESFQHINFRKK